MKFKKVSLAAAACAVSLGLLAGCGQSASSSASNDNGTTEASNVAKVEADTAAAAAAPGANAGFEELPVSDENEKEVQVTPTSKFNVGAVYFQPVDMESGANTLSAADADIHIEADISALENDLGYGVGDWIPYMTVEYKVINQDSGEVAAEGSCMTMNASDGPHYGANIKLPNAGTYTAKFILHSPAENDYYLHVDNETGVPGRFWNDPVEVEFPNWNYDGPISLN